VFAHAFDPTAIGSWPSEEMLALDVIGAHGTSTATPPAIQPTMAAANAHAAHATDAEATSGRGRALMSCRPRMCGRYPGAVNRLVLDVAAA
jgi:hypothetical protein